MIDEIKELIEAHTAKEKAYSECEYDRAYFCYSECDRLSRAEEDLERAINKVIDARLVKLGLLVMKE